ncbi:hypothetical protein Oant_2168 [Brucella anthropi ATCC 49188]|uniref:Uncharacterized protein n=1 Tax=Brucella anthropi (strain ATCC 49188 / DSM 6882 / CCUG 24695 / JCM 21032 / LMG 3331 / NBRC 15819 / NCTC 12168 / Alc 37) TaxID=439375 RepID=A6X0Y0_BRUA4|nr:hypothetical protein Oant_2168 [Brucella anthropi ATCC 49188]
MENTPGARKIYRIPAMFSVGHLNPPFAGGEATFKVFSTAPSSLKNNLKCLPRKGLKLFLD